MTEPAKEYTLALIRTVSRRIKHIDEEVIAVGVALTNGLIGSKKAREMIEDIAPGCLDAVALSILDGKEKDAAIARPDRSF